MTSHEALANAGRCVTSRCPAAAAAALRNLAGYQLPLSLCAFACALDDRVIGSAGDAPSSAEVRPNVAPGSEDAGATAPPRGGDAGLGRGSMEGLPSEGTEPGAGKAPAPESLAPERALVLSTSRLDFGIVGLGQTSSRLLEITNRSQDSVLVNAEVQGTSGNATAFDVGLECDEPLSPNATCEVPVSFTPPSLGDWQATLRLSGDGSELASIDLLGEARPPPFLVSDESSFAFEPLEVGRAAVHRWVVTNDGGVETSLISVRFLQSSVDAIDFDVVTDCARLAAGTSCNVDVTFAPTEATPQSGRVNASAASGIAGVGPYQIELFVSGTGL